MNTLNKKLEEGESMTFNEYILAYLRMIGDPRANRSHLIYYHMERLQHLAEDASQREWAASRAWSQKTPDEIEAGSYMWQDTQIIQLDRVQKAINTPTKDYRVAAGPM